MCQCTRGASKQGYSSFKGIACQHVSEDCLFNAMTLLAVAHQDHEIMSSGHCPAAPSSARQCDSVICTVIRSWDEAGCSTSMLHQLMKGMSYTCLLPSLYQHLLGQCSLPHILGGL